MIKIAANHWYKITKLNLAVASRKAGFDLAIYNDYSTSVRTELKKHTIAQMISDLYERVEDEHEIDLAEFRKAAYVISVCAPLTIQYPLGRSHVIYIGIGNAGRRIETHFKHKLFDFMQSLAGAEFNLQISLPKRAGSADYFKHVEFLMLKYFADNYSGSARTLPLLNKNRGSNKRLSADSEWWKRSIKLVGKKPIWTLNPVDIPKSWVLD